MLCPTPSESEIVATGWSLGTGHFQSSSGDPNMQQKLASPGGISTEGLHCEVLPPQHCQALVPAQQEIPLSREAGPEAWWNQ